MIVIRDQLLRLLVLAQLIRELKAANGEQAPTPAGFSDRQIEELKALSSEELVQLAEMTEPRVAVQIDAGCGRSTISTSDPGSSSISSGTARPPTC